MKKIIVFALVACLLSLSGFANSGSGSLKTQGKVIKEYKLQKNIKVVLKKNSQKKAYYECYNFGYYRECANGPVCLEYTMCGSFQEVWQNHLNFEMALDMCEC